MRTVGASWAWLVLVACSGNHEIGQYRGAGGDSGSGGASSGPMGGAGAESSVPADSEGDGERETAGGAGGTVSVGTAGVPAPPNAGAAGSTGAPGWVIDDFEDGDLMLVETAQRSGPWLSPQESWACEAPSLEVVAPGAESSLHALVAGFGCSARFDELVRGHFSSTPLAEGGWETQPYDASSFDGLAFTAKVSENLGELALTVVLRVTRPEPCTTPVCYVEYAAAAAATKEWSRTELPWRNFEGGSGVTGYVPLDPSRLESVTLRVDQDVASPTDAAEPFELWLDDVMFVSSLAAANTE